MGLEFRTSSKNSGMVVTTADFSESAKAFMKTLDPETQLKLIKKIAQRSYSQAKKNQINALKTSGIKRVTGTLRRSFKVISSYGKTYGSSVFVWVGIPRGKKDTLRPYWGQILCMWMVTLKSILKLAKNIQKVLQVCTALCLIEVHIIKMEALELNRIILLLKQTKARE